LEKKNDGVIDDKNGDDDTHEVGWSLTFQQTWDYVPTTPLQKLQQKQQQQQTLREAEIQKFNFEKVVLATAL